MPIYEYEREDGTTFEIIQKNSEPLTVCPTTGQKVKRKISAVISHFKGSGFYQTDYNGGNASAGTKGGSSSSSESKASSDSGSSTTTETKKHGCAAGKCGCS